ncbi:MAG: metallophosphoesterase [Bacteroidales bacterium]|nr:metallophosphoesterase [Bacteroidales bacterium]
MLRILLLSDIHFIHCEDDEDEYRSLETAFKEAMDDIRESGGVNQILICGDIANKGKAEEFDKAEEFIQDVFQHLGCDEKQTQLYVVPGNHDIDREINKSSRLSFRPVLLDPDKGDDFIYNAKHKELNALRILYSPLEAYHKFANIHSSADAIAVGILEGAPNFNDKGFRKEVKLGTLDNYVIMLHCLNSTLVCDETEVNDPNAIAANEHKLYLPKYAYNADTPITNINISMMHHPLAWFENSKAMQDEFDRKFKVQIYGHVHTQSIEQEREGKSAIRLQCGSLHPGKYGNPDLYPPVYNILEIRVSKGILRLKVICYSWDGERFMKNERFCYTREMVLPKKKKRTAHQRREVSQTKSNEMNAKEMYDIRYRFFTSRHIKEIILAMNPKAYDESKPEHANAISFFRSISAKVDEVARLQEKLNAYTD